MKVTTEKMPRSMLALDIELEPTQFEKGLDRAARRLAQKVNIPGFRKGKAPRFVIERYVGREALIEEASNDLMNQSFRDAIKQEQITPIGDPELVSVDTSDAFRFRVQFPISPSITLADYRSIRVPLNVEPVTEEMIEQEMIKRRERHVALRELDDPRPVQQGDQVKAKIEIFVGDEPFQQASEGQELPDETIILEPDRLFTEVYEELPGTELEETREIAVHVPEAFQDERIAGKDTRFKIHVTAIQERVIPEWEELPELEEFEGSLDEFRQQVAKEIEKAVEDAAEKKVVQEFMEHVIAQSTYDIADVTIHQMADRMLTDQEQQYTRLGITQEQLYQSLGRNREAFVEDMLPAAEKQVKHSMAIMRIIEQEHLTVSNEEFEQEVESAVSRYPEEQQEYIRKVIVESHREGVQQAVIDRKLQETMLAIALGKAADSSDEPEATVRQMAPTERGAENQDEGTPVQEEMHESQSEQSERVEAQEI